MIEPKNTGSSISVAHRSSNNEEEVRWRIPFGIGCWDFGIQKTGSFRMTLDEFVAELRQRLEIVQALNNLEIEASGDDVIDNIVDESNLTEVRGEKVLMGHGLLWHVRFDLYIPFRIQEDITETGIQLDTKTEKFRVHMHYPFHRPVCFVELLDDDGAEHPSSAMRLVRDYLEMELEFRKTNVVFDFVGPTPFHADFILENTTKPTATNSQFDIIQLKGGPGYAKIRVCWLAETTTIGAARDHIFGEIEEELGLFYLIASRDLEKWHRWRKIELLAEKVVENLRSKGAWHRMLSIRAQSHAVAALYCDIAEFRSTEIQYDHYIQNTVRKFYNENEVFHFRSFVESELERRPVFASEQMIDLIRFIEERRSKSVEMTIVVVAAVTGALVGSLITLLSTLVAIG